MAMKTPGVYIVEKNAFPNSVVEVATAVPAFIGYTEKADNKGKPLKNKPWRISSMVEFHEYFGGPPQPVFKIAEQGAASTDKKKETDKGAPPAANPDNAAEDFDFSQGDSKYSVEQVGGHYLLYRSIRLFFQNGGGPCFIVSVGGYSKEPQAKAQEIEKGKLAAGIEPLVKEQEPTMVVVPEAVMLNSADCYSLQVATLMHCGSKMKNRVAILDVYDGDEEDSDSSCIQNFREGVGTSFLKFAAAYYPWVNTTIVEDSELNLDYFDSDSQKLLKTLLQADVGITKTASPDDLAKLKPLQDRINQIEYDWKAETRDDDTQEKKDQHASDLRKQLDNSLIALSPLYSKIRNALRERLNRLPPAAAMAGIYTMVDNSRGVWKAPANVSLNSVVSPAVSITHDEQESLNVHTTGKSINAIRSFIGEGTMVWGARTLDGNSLDWRYINVRRTMIMLEESIRLAAKAYVFEPNVANTWVTMKSMIRNFLTGIWKRGGLAGAVPDDAFSVHVGLGETMTPEDILEGILRITVLVAVSRPAEFIEITFQQQMQKS